jgi:hypothetical protein
MGTNKTGSNDATMKLEYLIKLQVYLEKMSHMSYLELKLFISVFVGFFLEGGGYYTHFDIFFKHIWYCNEL